MKVELLHIQECPNWREAGLRLEAAIESLGLDVPVDYRPLSSVQEIDGLPFSGSPTLVVDGEDLFPDAATIHVLACRVFRTPIGLRGVPEQEQVIDAMREHARTASVAESSGVAGREGEGGKTR